MDKLFNTKDFNTLVLLSFMGFRYERVEVDERGTKRVFYRDTPELQIALQEYDCGDARVDPKQWMRVVDETKQFVHR